MPQPLFLQNIIACIWDFDKTLIPGYMQTPIFEHYQVNSLQNQGRVQSFGEAN
jgi:hypothetical protein